MYNPPLLKNVPPHGFVYPQPVYGSVHPTILKGENEEDLISKIRQYRVDAGLPVGDPKLDYDQYQQRLQDERDGKIPVIEPYKPEEKPIRTLADRVTQWVSNRYTHAKSKINYVTTEEAERRAAICIKCPYNEVEWRQSIASCAPCLDNVDRNLLNLSKGNRTSLHKDLGACRFYGHDNSVAVWLPEELLKHRSQQEGEPEVECWMKEL